MEDVLSQISFDEGIALPVANEENKKLESELEKKQRDISRLRDDVELFTERIHTMSDHLKNVRQELQHTQEVFNARKRERETEIHMKQVADREYGRLRNESRRIQKELDELTERRNMYENNIFKGTEKLNEIKDQMKWDQQALDAWLQECDARDEDSLILQKYTRADESKVKELSLKQSKLVDDRALKRKALEHEITSTLTSQLELDKTAQAFRAAHVERQELLLQWEGTINQMQKRDDEIDQASLRLAELRIEVKNRENFLKERQQFLDNELLNNREKEKKISAAERTAAKLQLEYQTMEASRVQFQDELETLKFTVDRTAKDLESMRERVSRLKKDIVRKQEKFETAQLERQELQEQLKVITDTTLSAEDRALRLEEMLKKEEQHIHGVEKELHRLRELQFKKTQELYQVKQMETNLNAEIQGSRATSRNLSSKLNKLDQDALKQQEIIYNQNFQLQQLERKISRLHGERSDDEKLQLEAKIKDLTVFLDKQTSEHTLLTAQLKKLGDDLRRANRNLATGADEQKGLTSKIEELCLHNDSSDRELKKLTSTKQEMMVEENILKLEVKRLRDRLNYKADDVVSLENKRLELETAMKQRRQEIKIHMDMLRAQMKVAEEERQTVSSELHDRITKIEKLRKRYEILMVSMAPPEGEEDKTQAYYVIKAAQEKEELLRNGDELDAKIRKAEKEIRALENTLRVMNTKNETFRKNLSKVEQTSEEYEVKQKLEETFRAVMDKYKYKRRQIRELQEDLQTMSQTFEELNKEEDELCNAVEDKQTKISSLRKEIAEQDSKNERVEKQLSRLARDIRSAKGSKGELPEEKDIRVRELRDFNNSIMKQMGEIIHNYPDIVDSVQLYFSQAGLPLPSLASSTSGSRPPSSRSSRSSIASSRSLSSSHLGHEGREIITASVNIGADVFGGSSDRKESSTGKTPTRGSVGKVSPSPKSASRPVSSGSQSSKTSSRFSSLSKK